MYNAGIRSAGLINDILRDDSMAKHRYTPEEVAEWRKEHGRFFYFNKDDTNYSVQKLYGFGNTLNCAHPFAWVIGAAVLALIVYMLFFKQRNGG